MSRSMVFLLAFIAFYLMVTHSGAAQPGFPAQPKGEASDSIDPSTSNSTSMGGNGDVDEMDPTKRTVNNPARGGYGYGGWERMEGGGSIASGICCGGGGAGLDETVPNPVVVVKKVVVRRPRIGMPFGGMFGDWMHPAVRALPPGYYWQK